MNHENWMQDGLGKLRGQTALRSLTSYAAAGGKITVEGKPVLNFSSNDYLDLARHPHVLLRAHEALDRFGAGATASRLVTGTLPIHEEFEERLARHKGYPASLLFGSGYMTNAGVIPALVVRDDTVIADRLVHASVIDAITLSRARLIRFQHNDVDHLRDALAGSGEGRRLVVTESVFSMDGDLAPLDDIARAAGDCGAMLMIDEAHATGVFGPHGAGLVAVKDLQHAVHLSMCTLSKALGGYGGAVACSALMKQWLINKARALIYTTAPPPASIGAALGALDVLEREAGLGNELLRRARLFRERLHAAGIATMQSASQIVPVMAGSNARAISLSRRLRERGMVVVAIRPPTVPDGTSRLRFSITLAHEEADVARATDEVIAAMQADKVTA
ncbi:MAG: 8-amino-7-oxononanoate synthase [bacterium]